MRELFDKHGRLVNWFDETEHQVGWFDEDLSGFGLSFQLTEDADTASFVVATIADEIVLDADELQDAASFDVATITALEFDATEGQDGASFSLSTGVEPPPPVRVATGGVSLVRAPKRRKVHHLVLAAVEAPDRAEFRLSVVRRVDDPVAIVPELLRVPSVTVTRSETIVSSVRALTFEAREEPDRAAFVVDRFDLIDEEDTIMAAAAMML